MKKILYTLILIAVAGLSASAQTNKSAVQKAETKTPESPAATANAEGPHIQFTKQVHDYGQIVQGANGDCEFEFTNTGKEPLILMNVQASCGCTVPSWSREPIMPGQKSTIKIHYDTNRLGNIGKAVTVYSNSVGDNSERLTLRLAGNVNPKQN